MEETKKPLVSVITPTWKRHELLLELLENIDELDTSLFNLEHVIVSEGPDPTLYERIVRQNPKHNILYLECGINWSSELTESYCAAPMIMGQLAAHGEYQTWLADDERADPLHLRILFDALQRSGRDFAYTRTLMWYRGEPTRRFEIGQDTPEHGQITNCMYHRRLLDKGLYRTHVTRAGDWDQIERWMQRGASWIYVPIVTLTHRIDN